MEQRRSHPNCHGEHLFSRSSPDHAIKTLAVRNYSEPETPKAVSCCRTERFLDSPVVCLGYYLSSLPPGSEVLDKLPDFSGLSFRVCKWG